MLKNHPTPANVNLANLIVDKAAVTLKYAGGMNADDVVGHRAGGI